MFKKRSVSVLLFTSFITIVFMTTLLLTLLNNYLFSSNFREEWKKRNLLSLNVISTELREKIFIPVEQINKQIMTDTQSEVLNYLSQNKSVVARTNVHKYLNRIVALNNNIIDYIDVYYIDDDLIISSRNGIKQNLSANENSSVYFPWIEDMYESSEIAKWISSVQVDNLSSSYNALFYAKTFPFLSQFSSASMCLAICIREDVVVEVLNKAKEDLGENVFLIDKNMNFFANYNPDITESFLRKSLTETFFIDKIGNTRLYAAKQNLGRPDFTIIKTTPTSSINRYVYKNTFLMFLSSLLVMLLGFIVSGKISNTIYNPLNNLMKQLEHNIKQETISPNEYEVIGDTLKQLSKKVNDLDIIMEQNKAVILHRIIMESIRKNNHVDNSEIFNKFNDLEIKFNYGYYTIGLLVFNKLFFENLNYKNAQIIKTNLLIKFEEINGAKIIATETSDTEMLLLINCDSFDLIEKLFNELIDEINNSMIVISYVAIGDLCNKLNSLYTSHETAKTASAYHYIYPDVKLLVSADFQANEQNTAKPDTELCNNFMRALYKNDTIEVANALNKIKVHMREKYLSYEMCNNLILEIIFLFAQFLKEYNFHSNNLMGSNVFEQFYNIDNIEDTNEWILNLCENAFNKIQYNHQLKENTLVNKIKEFVKQNISSDTSLNAVAEHTYVSISYLCTIFKKETGISYLDYVNEQRFAIACELLKTTNKKLDEISSLAGFSGSNYFIKAFKKQYGLTPNNYRLLKSNH